MRQLLTGNGNSLKKDRKGSLSQTRGERKGKQKCRNLGYIELLLLVFNFTNHSICITGNIIRTKARCLQICIDLHMFSDIGTIVQKQVWSIERGKWKYRNTSGFKLIYSAYVFSYLLPVYYPSSLPAGDFHSSIRSPWQSFTWRTMWQPHLLP